MTCTATRFTPPKSANMNKTIDIVAFSVSEEPGRRVSGAPPIAANRF
jgi:hypothetical protein